MEKRELNILKKKINQEIDRLLAAQCLSEEEKAAVLNEAIQLTQSEKKKVE